MTDGVDTTTRKRPGAVTLLAIYMIGGGIFSIASTMPEIQGISQGLSGSASGLLSIVVFTVLGGMLLIAAGIGTWLGKPWGWWLAAFYHFFAVLATLATILGTPGSVGSLGEPAPGTGPYYWYEMVRIGLNLLIIVYWFSRGVLAYFGLGDLSRRKASLILAGVTVVAVVAVVVSPVLTAGFNRDLDRIAQIYEQGDVLTAIDELEEYLGSYPGNDLAWTTLGNMYTDVGAYGDAEAACNRAIEINPGGYEAWNRLGALNREGGDNERAMERYEKALEINPNYADAHNNMAIVALDLYLDAKALEHAKKAYELDKHNPIIAANLASVKQAVHKLLEMGIETVHVVADHGFLLLQEVAEHEKVAAHPATATAIKARYLVGRGLGSTKQLDFPVLRGEGLEAWFPCGVGCFKTPGRYNYVHGGLSLQEVVVPQLTVKQKQIGRPVGVQVELPAVIRQGQLQIILQPEAESLVDQPRRVSLSLEKAGEPVVPPFEATVFPSGPATLDVWLPHGCGLEIGDRAEWVLRDRLTGEELRRQEVVSEVDLW